MLTSAEIIAHVSKYLLSCIITFQVILSILIFAVSKVFGRKLLKSAMLISEFTAFPKAFSLVFF